MVPASPLVLWVNIRRMDTVDLVEPIALIAPS